MSTCQALVHTQPGPEKQASVFSPAVIIAHPWALKVIANSKLASVSSQNFAAFCHCFATCPCFASCGCCHDPFIVRSARTCPPFTGFNQLTHPSRCSRSTLTTVCFCAFDSSRDHVWSLCMCRGCSPLHLVVECGIHGQQNTNPANLQCCCSAEAESLVLFQHPRSSSL